MIEKENFGKSYFLHYFRKRHCSLLLVYLILKSFGMEALA